MKKTAQPTMPLCKSKLGALSLTILAASLAAMSSQAATVTFDSPQTITSDAVLDLPLAYSGATLAQAVDFGSGGGYGGALSITTANQTINFTAGTMANAAPPFSGTSTTLYNAGSQGNATLFPGTTGNSSFDSLLRSDGWHNNASDSTSPLSLRIGGLTVGNIYVLSLFDADARTTDRDQAYFDTFSGGVFSGGQSSSFSQNPGTIVMGTFTADSTTQDIFIHATDLVGNADTQFAGFTLYSVTAVPEPSTFAMMAGGFGVLLTGFRMRKQK